MTYNGIVSRKLNLLQEQLNDLRSWGIVSYPAFCGNSQQQRAVERALQICVEIMIDVCERILAVQGIAPADSSVGNLQRVAQLGLIEDAVRYEPMIRFRNFIVHRYELVDPEMLFDIVVNHLGDFECFIGEIANGMPDDESDQS